MQRFLVCCCRYHCYCAVHSVVTVAVRGVVTVVAVRGVANVVANAFVIVSAIVNVLNLGQT